MENFSIAVIMRINKQIFTLPLRVFVVQVLWGCPQAVPRSTESIYYRLWAQADLGSNPDPVCHTMGPHSFFTPSESQGLSSKIELMILTQHPTHMLL